MNLQVRLAREDDLDALFALSGLTGGGMVNFPHDRDFLAERIAWSLRSIETAVEAPKDEFYLLVLEEAASGHVVGTGCIFARLGARWPFYSYKLSRVTHVSRDLDRIFSTHILNLVNDFDGASEVGGLFVHPEARVGGAGALMARSRYMFIAQHRQRFSDCVVAEMRGWRDNGVSPFWEAVGKPFFGSEIDDADLHNALHGNQFIADLMPRYPIYITMLPSAACDAIGRVDVRSEPARHLLEMEGFAYDGYVDIFDAGPTLSVRTDAIQTISQSRLIDEDRILRTSETERPISAMGTGADFRCWQGGASDDPLGLASA